MHLTTDVLVIGSGISGLTAALAAAKSGVNVSIVTAGAGTYAISSGCVDLLGQVQGKFVSDPWQALEQLPDNHPYKVIGSDNVRQALDFFTQITASYGREWVQSQDAHGQPINTLIPTIIGTFKPSYLLPKTIDAESLFAANSVLVCGVTGLRDASPKLIAANLAKHPKLAKTQFNPILLPSPKDHPHRSLTALDIARFVDTDEGLNWLKVSLGKYAKAYDCVLLPPILGVNHTAQIFATIKDLLQCKVSEMLTTPPGVGGMRLHNMLLAEATKLKIRILENCKITEARVEANHCLSVATSTKNPLTLTAKAYVLATGGILGGGLELEPNEAIEPIFKIKEPLDSGQMGLDDIFGPHPIAKIGVNFDQNLHPQISQDTFVDNVFLAGKILAGYDYAAEKCGHGLAIASGWLAGNLSATTAQQA